MEAINPQGIERGDKVLRIKVNGEYELHEVQWVDNEKGIVSLKTSIPNFYVTTETPRSVKLIEKGCSAEESSISAALPLNPDGIKEGDLVWSSIGPALISVLDEERGVAILDTAHELSIPSLSICCKAHVSDIQIRYTALKKAYLDLKGGVE